jgi:hypothetical protein
MTRVFLLITLLSIGIILQAQKKCKVALHPTESGKSILSCCNKNIKDGNNVVYTKGRKAYEIEAVAINYNGKYGGLKNDNSSVLNKVLADNNPDNFYKGHNCDYYYTKYKQANTQKWAGVIITSCGLGVAIGGGIYGSNYDYTVGVPVFLSGIILSSAGAALWISGGIKRANNRKAMEKCERAENLSFIISKNGIGLALSF